MAERTAPAVGLRLKSVREAKGIAIRSIADATKLGTPVLEAVERGEFSKLPGGIYRRSVIRSYAAAVGLDPNDVLAAFMAECPQHIEPAPTLDTSEEEAAAAHHAWTERLPGLGPALRAGVPFVFALAAGYAVLSWTMRGDPVLPSSTPDLVMANALLAVPVEPAITRVAQMLRGTGSDAVVAAIPAAALTIELLPDASCWVSLGVDGGPPDSRLLEPGERVVVEAEREVVLEVGDAGAVSLWVNGHPARPLGEPGQAATVRISADTLPAVLGS